ncbi:MAG: type IV pilus assembly protein PilM [Candidatus Pacebacteria bacterium]|nr:type IV pilus assembly protein PilM [Candidatus Paceibacterota bacterium]
MFNFLELEPESFGLDFSDSYLRIVKLEKKRDGFDVASYAERKIDPDIIKNGEVKKEEELAKAIRETVNAAKGKKVRTNYVVASLPENKSFLQVIQMPLISKEDLKAAVVYEAENYIPLPIEEVYFDSEIVTPIENHLNHYDVLISALPKKTVNLYLSSLEKAGLRPLALETESFSITRALVKNQTAPSPVAIIDFGQTKTMVIIFSGKSLRFSFCAPVGAYDFDEVISKALKVNLKEAEYLRAQYGLEQKENKGKEVFEALYPALSVLADEIKKYIDYYENHSAHEHLSTSGKKISKILLSGPGADIKGVTKYFSERFLTKAEIGDPWVNVLTDKQRKFIEPSFKGSINFASALGLALRGVKNK